MNIKNQILFIIINFCLVACDFHSSKSQQIPNATEFHPIQSAGVVMIRGQLIYVPIYSSLPYAKDGHIPLNAVLSIRNTSNKESIIISKVEYFDTNGKSLRNFITTSFRLGKMATKEFVIPSDDLSGGTGANFIVRWDSENAVSTPIIESIMYGTLGTNSFSFTSRGQEIESH